MGTWTKMKITNLVQIEWADSQKKFVTCKTVYGSMTESVERLREKLQGYLLPPIRSIFQDMLDFAEKPEEK